MKQLGNKSSSASSTSFSDVSNVRVYSSSSQLSEQERRRTSVSNVPPDVSSDLCCGTSNLTVSSSKNKFSDQEGSCTSSAASSKSCPSTPITTDFRLKNTLSKQEGPRTSSAASPGLYSSTSIKVDFESQDKLSEQERPRTPSTAPSGLYSSTSIKVDFESQDKLSEQEGPRTPSTAPPGSYSSTPIVHDSSSKYKLSNPEKHRTSSAASFGSHSSTPIVHDSSSKYKLSNPEGHRTSSDASSDSYSSAPIITGYMPKRKLSEQEEYDTSSGTSIVAARCINKFLEQTKYRIPSDASSGSYSGAPNVTVRSLESKVSEQKELCKPSDTSCDSSFELFSESNPELTVVAHNRSSKLLEGNCTSSTDFPGTSSATISNSKTESLEQKQQKLVQSLSKNTVNNVPQQRKDSCNESQNNPPSVHKILCGAMEMIEEYDIKSTETTQENLPTEATRKYTKKVKWLQLCFVKELIPIFEGKEEDDVNHWLDKISIIEHQCQINEEIIMLSAIMQLKGRALKWFNRQPSEKVKYWKDFKTQIQSYFKRKVPDTTMVITIAQRFWKIRNEKFMDYAEEKLSLMELLNLSDQEKIELLIDGVREPTLRMIILGASFTSVSNFLNYVCKITEDKIVSIHISNQAWTTKL